MATPRLKSPATSASTSALSDDGSQTTVATATRDWTPRHTQARPPSSPRSRSGSPEVGFARAPTEFGFPTELWTAPRVAQVIERTYGITFHLRYLNAWLADRDITPHKPKRQSRERVQDEIDRRIEEDWDQIQETARKVAESPQV